MFGVGKKTPSKENAPGSANGADKSSETPEQKKAEETKRGKPLSTPDLLAAMADSDSEDEIVRPRSRRDVTRPRHRPLVPPSLLGKTSPLPDLEQRPASWSSRYRHAADMHRSPFPPQTRVVAREELTTLSPTELKWDDDDESDAARAAKPAKRPSILRGGNWLNRLNKTPDAAEVEPMSRRDVVRANTIEKQQSKRAAELNLETTPASGPSGNNTTSATRASPVRILLAAVEATTRLALYACLLVAMVALAVYIDTHNPGVWVPVWRLKTIKLADVPASLARLARTVAADAAKAAAPTMATFARETAFVRECAAAATEAVRDAGERVARVAFPLGF